MFAGYAVVVRTWNFHIWNNGNDQETGKKSQTSQRNTALINGNTFAFDEPHCKCFLFPTIFTGISTLTHTVFLTMNIKGIGSF